MALSTQTKIFIPVGLLFALIGFGFCSAWYREFRREDAFSRALVTQGVVTGKRFEYGSRSPNSNTTPRFDYVSFEYSIAGRPIKIEQMVYKATYESVKEGMKVPIYYLADRPSEGLIEKPARGWMLLAMGGPFLAIGVIMLLVSVPQALGAAAFGARSVIVDGAVISLSEAPLIINDEQAQRVYYRFKDADGVEHRGFSDAMKPADAALFRPGGAVKIRYSPSDAEENELVFDRQIKV